MATVEQSIVIRTSVEKVFAFVSDPAHVTEFWPSMIAVNNVQPLPNGGHRFNWVYKMAGMRFEGTSEDVEYEPNQRMVQRSTGGIQATITWTFQPEAEGTRVTFQGAYTVPVPLIGRLAEAVIVKMNEHEAETLLVNLKALMEG